ncbi:MAG: two-component regulator propeller domain-containing protein [Crocinitomicaceae bacterium]
MKNSCLHIKISLIILTCSYLVSCKGQTPSNNSNKTNSEKVNVNLDSQIGAYVVEIFQDSKYAIWFGTLEKGVAKYDGEELSYLTTKDGLPSNRIVDLVEDKLGNLWFGTGSGVAKFDGKSFTNFSVKDGLCSDMISQLFLDSKGGFWIGTWGGVSKFDGLKFENFTIPYPEIETKINPDTKNWITTITEDSKGNIWFGRDGYGACKYDGKSFVHYTTKEGLNSNNVQAIVEDKEGNIWIGTRVAEKDNADIEKRSGEGGLNKFDGKKIIQFPNIDGLSKNDVYGIYLDASNDLWISTISQGVYKYTNKNFVNYQVPITAMTFLKDVKGNVWLGCSGGLYKIDKTGSVINVKTSGPWD